MEKRRATWDEYKNIVRICRDATRTAKVHLELNLARDIKDNKKGFFKSISSKRKSKENLGSLLNESLLIRQVFRNPKPGVKRGSLEKERCSLGQGGLGPGEMGREEPDKVQLRQVQVPHLGKNNPTHRYMLGADSLESGSVEKYPGVLLDNKLPMSQQCDPVAKQINGT
ncbi:hypothetical protein BTVI_12165 [Pitangus sulphuratus]|nr:hypothetical protein BTVI_12165 [Pitangus sulphuratus]